MHIVLEVVIGAEHKGQHARQPESAEERAELEQLLIVEVIARIDLEDEHVVDARTTPAVHVEADEEQVEQHE